MSPTWPIAMRPWRKLTGSSLAVEAGHALPKLRVLVSQTGDPFA